MTTALTAAIDVDRHIDPPTSQQLTEFLPRKYAEQIIGSGMTTAPNCNRWYPPPAVDRQTPPPTSVAMPMGAQAPITSYIITCLTGFESTHDPYLGAALASAINEWLGTVVLSEDPNGLTSMCVSLADPDAAVREIDKWAAQERFVRVLLPVRSDSPYGNVRYRKVLEACDRNDLVAALHAWGAGSNPSTPSGPAELYAEDYLANGGIAEAQIASLISEGVFEVCPDLRVSVLECGFTWMPAFMWRLDKDWKGLWREIPWVKRAPSEYFYEHFRVSTTPAHLPREPQQVREVLDIVRGRDLLMFATDHPHTHGDHVALDLEALDPAEAAAIAYGNAAAHYRIAAADRP